MGCEVHIIISNFFLKSQTLKLKDILNKKMLEQLNKS